ncbi:interferon-induced protein with tetratricopeptide repeats 5-like isoform X2 [Myxocyprinus asiaticus]|uniref:interferon-induced protein with tetratricopeptide repeats 5-like isoform X2 n=1 Tax=Myxocyprinus asiaticus TaxID=70543 RepID=UPI002223D4A6|nr:interferon-induced protein with tetratricopeptide repeats 5-like isoform X2 [Myxocyprinus asiaticus]XP_051523508.1 interferon-induced protein with tetratricopeptide repeats 5-like isoform X2 [Myxocyprinus asiaticus]
MSVNQDSSLRENLLQLECHFTWALIKDDLDLTDVLNRLEEQIKLDLGKNEGLARTYSALAYVKFLLGFHEEALCNLMKSVKLNMECHGEEFHKTLIVTYGNLAWLNYHMKNYTECESYLKKLHKINELIPSESPSVPEVLGEKGWTFLKFSCKYYDRAKECFRKALELEPEEGEWNTGYAIALYRTEYEIFNLEDSLTIKQLRRAIDKNPDDDVLKVLLGIRLVVFKKYDEAESLVKMALERSPEHPHVMRYVGKFFRNKGCVDRSITLLKRALENVPNSCFIHHQLALSYKLKKIQLLQEGSHHAKMSKVQQIRDQCIYHLEKATSLNSSFISAMSDLALQYGERRDMSRAEELFEITFKTAKEKNDNLHVINFYYAEFQLHCLRCEALAIKHYMECLKMSPKSVEGKKSAYNLKKITEKHIHRNTVDGNTHGILGFLHREKGEKRQAIECYEKALSYADNDEYLSNLCALRLSLQ